MTDTSALAPSTNAQLSRGIMGLEAQVYAAAQAELDLVTADSNFTTIEKQSMLEGEALRMTNGLELGTIIMRGRIIRKIVDGGLARQHPNQYSSYREMAADCGLSHSEISKTENLVNVVFPGLEELGFSIPRLWEEIGKTNFMELIPYFRLLMTGEQSASQAVNETVERMVNDAHATAQSAGGAITDREATRYVIGELVDNGVHLTNNELRRRVRPDHTPLIETTYIQSNGRTIVIAEVDHDQMDMFSRIMGRHVSPQVFDLPTDPQRRMMEAAQIPAIVKVADLISMMR